MEPLLVLVVSRPSISKALTLSSHILYPKPSQLLLLQTSLPAPTLNAIPTLAEQLCGKGDKSLSRLAPPTFSENGRPRIITYEVFQKGADLHKDFIVCYFNGRASPFHQIQSVLNHMWGKGRKLEIHNNPLNYSAIVRISSITCAKKYLRNIFGMLEIPCFTQRNGQQSIHLLVIFSVLSNSGLF